MLFIDNENKLLLMDHRIVLMGHTFTLKKPPFIPMIDLSPPNNILFSPTIINNTVY